MTKPTDTPRTARCDEEAPEANVQWVVAATTGTQDSPSRRAPLANRRDRCAIDHRGRTGVLQRPAARSRVFIAKLGRRFGHLKTGTRRRLPDGRAVAASDRCVGGGGAPRLRLGDARRRSAVQFTNSRAAACPASISCTTIFVAWRPRFPARGAARPTRRRAAARAPLRSKRCSSTSTLTVTPLFGEQEGARPGPNPRYHGRPSYHPILARIAQTGTIIGARACGRATRAWVRPTSRTSSSGSIARAPPSGRARSSRRASTRAAHCAALLRAIDGRGAWFLVKMKQTPNLVGAVGSDQAMDHRRPRRARRADAAGRGGRLRARGLAAGQMEVSSPCAPTCDIRQSVPPLEGPGLLRSRLRNQMISAP